MGPTSHYLFLLHLPLLFCCFFSLSHYIINIHICFYGWVTSSLPPYSLVSFLLFFFPSVSLPTSCSCRTVWPIGEQRSGKWPAAPPSSSRGCYRD
uniref:Uncharacterized protein n=1 Tax=Anguilla anguilla TaxID=7936 RepID=A0A0E9X624_ANGAN